MRHADKSPEEQVEILKKAGIKRMTDFPQKEVKFLWYPYIPSGKVTIIQGDPAGGKTTLILKLLSVLSNQVWEYPKGHKLWFLSPLSMYLTAEDGYGDTVVPRLVQNDAKLESIYTIQKTNEFWSLMDSLVDVVDIMMPEIIVLDPLQAFFGNGDMNRANDVRNVMSMLGEIAETYGTAIVLIGHLNKKSGDNEMYRGLGSIDFVAAARSVIQVTQTKTGQRVMKHIKSSLAPKGEDLEIVIGDKVELIPYEPPAIEGKRETQTSKVPEATKALIANMKNQTWTRMEIVQWLRDNWQITSDQVQRQIIARLDKQECGRHTRYTAPLEEVKKNE